MEKIIVLLKYLEEIELNNSELLVLCTLESAGYMKVNDMIERFGWSKRFTEDNISRLQKKGYLAQSGQGFRYKLSKNGIHLVTELFQKINPIGTGFNLSI
jgi:predicted DNA-binding transcriptional regulator